MAYLHLVVTVSASNPSLNNTTDGAVLITVCTGSSESDANSAIISDTSVQYQITGMTGSNDIWIQTTGSAWVAVSASHPGYTYGYASAVQANRLETAQFNVSIYGTDTVDKAVPANFATALSTDLSPNFLKNNIDTLVRSSGDRHYLTTYQITNNYSKFKCFGESGSQINNSRLATGVKVNWASFSTGNIYDEEQECGIDRVPCPSHGICSSECTPYNECPTDNPTAENSLTYTFTCSWNATRVPEARVDLTFSVNGNTVATGSFSQTYPTQYQGFGGQSALTYSSEYEGQTASVYCEIYTKDLRGNWSGPYSPVSQPSGISLINGDVNQSVEITYNGLS